MRSDGVLTTASVMALQIPEPPPVQKRTFPLKRSLWKTAVEATGAGSTWRCGAMID